MINIVKAKTIGLEIQTGSFVIVKEDLKKVTSYIETHLLSEERMDKFNRLTDTYHNSDVIRSEGNLIIWNTGVLRFARFLLEIGLDFTLCSKESS